MSTAPFLMVRVLDDRIRTREQAIEGLHWHIESRVLLTRRDVGVGLMRGQKLVAVAAYAGRGLVIFGTVSGTEWVPWTEPHSIYKQAIPVEWEPVIYSYDVENHRARGCASAAPSTALSENRRHRSTRGRDGRPRD